MATTTVTTDVPLVAQPEPPAGRPRVLLVGTALGLAGVVVGFAGMLGLYLAQRHHALSAPKGKWFPAGAIPLTGPNIALFTLLLSIPMVHWAGQALRNDDRINTWIALGVTLLMGLAFINATAYVWANSHLGIDKAPGLMLYTVTGAHVALVAVGMIFLVLTVFRTIGGDSAAHDGEMVTAATLFWDVTVAIFAVLWFAIYVTK